MSWDVIDRRLARAEAAAGALFSGPVRMAPAWVSPVDLAAALGLTVDGWQAGLLASTARRVVVLAPRQVGKSLTLAVLALHVATSTPGGLALVVSPAERQATEVVRTVRELAAQLAIETAETESPIAPSAVSLTKVVFPNEARILSVPGGNEAGIRGFTPTLILADEASRIADATFAALRPMLVAQPSCRLILASTPWLKIGTFFDACHDESGAWQRHRVTIDDCPRLSRDFIEEERRSLPDYVFRREYLGEFADDAASLFPAELIEAAFDEGVAPLPLRPFRGSAA
jgi:hypothetical protein